MEAKAENMMKALSVENYALQYAEWQVNAWRKKVGQHQEQVKEHEEQVKEHEEQAQYCSKEVNAWAEPVP